MTTSPFPPTEDLISTVLRQTISQADSSISFDMCATEITFSRGCGHASYSIMKCPEFDVGSCEHTTQRAVRLGFCSSCVVDPSKVLHFEQREARFREFDSRIERDLARDFRDEFNAELSDVHILASINSDRLSHAEARALSREYSQVTQRLQDRVRAPEEAFVWPIDRLDGFHDDDNRQHVLGAALFRIPERILRGFSHVQLRDHILLLSEDLEARRHEVRADTITLRLARRILLSTSPRDPTGRTASERAFEMQVRRAHNIPLLLSVTDTSALSDAGADRECMICMTDYGTTTEGQQAEEPCELPCGHFFGRRCISYWLNDHSSCPYCRRDYKTELTRVPALNHDPAVVVIGPPNAIPEATRREGQAAQSVSRREHRRGNLDQVAAQNIENTAVEVDVEPHAAEDPDEPAGDANFQADLAAAARTSVEQILRQQLEIREQAHTTMITPIRDSLRNSIDTIQSGSNSRRQNRFLRIQELEAQLDDDRLSETSILTSQVHYQELLDAIDRYLLVLLEERAIIVSDMRGHQGENPIMRRHDGLLDDAYRLRDLLQRAIRQAELEIQRLRVDIEQGYISIDDAYIHSSFQDEIESNENQDEFAEEEEEEEEEYEPEAEQFVEIIVHHEENVRGADTPANSPEANSLEFVVSEDDQTL